MRFDHGSKKGSKFRLGSGVKLHFGVLNHVKPTFSATKQFEHKGKDLADSVPDIHDVPQRAVKMDLELERVAFFSAEPSHLDFAEKPSRFRKR